LTKKGCVSARETEKGLSETRERDRRFDVSPSVHGGFILQNSISYEWKAEWFLETEQKRFQMCSLSNGREYLLQEFLLFKHTLQFMQSEMAFLKNLVNNWRRPT